MDSEEEFLRRSKVQLKNRKMLSENGGQKDGIQPSSSQKVLDPSERGIVPCSASETEEERSRKVGRPKRSRRAVDPEEAERRKLAATGEAPEHMQDLLQSMTASDINAQALEYLEHIEMIRVKSGRLQGDPSGELKKRKICLGEMIRVLQFKAESKNDPEFLKHKLDELTNEIKKEEEKRKREVSELRDIIKELKQENKEMREELRRVKEEVRKSSEERIENGYKKDARREKEMEETSQKGKKDTTQRKRFNAYLPKHLSRDESRSREKSRSRSPSIVMRPLLGGKSMPIPENLKHTKEERLDVINRQIEALTKARAKICRTDEEREEEEEKVMSEQMMPPPLPRRNPKRVKENIQLVPPRTDWVQQEASKDQGKVQGEGEVQDEGWTKVTGRQKRREKRKKGECLSQPAAGSLTRIG